jgi:enamine deaminase RidA (YjgF/YER057c/UK114 family)
VTEQFGSGLDHVLKINGYLIDRSQLKPYNRIYSRWFGDHLPARTTVWWTRGMSPWKSTASHG